MYIAQIHLQAKRDLLGLPDQNGRKMDVVCYVGILFQGFTRKIPKNGMISILTCFCGIICNVAQIPDVICKILHVEIR